jgi:bacteriorhodopsin
MLHWADTFASAALFCLTAITVTHVMSPPRSLLHLSSMQIATFVAVMASLHYYMETSEDDRSKRAVIRFVDWIVTAPLMRMQLYAIEGRGNEEEVKRMFVSTQGFMVFSLWAELTPYTELRFILGVISIVLANYSIVIIQTRPIPSAMEDICRHIMVLYTLVYVSVLGGPQTYITREVLFALMDTTVKTLFVAYLWVQSGNRVGVVPQRCAVTAS